MSVCIESRTNQLFTATPHRFTASWNLPTILRVRTRSLPNPYCNFARPSLIRSVPFILASVLLVGCSKPATTQSGNAALLSFSDQRGLELGTYPDRVLKVHFSVDEIRKSAKSHQRLVQRKYLSNISYSGDLLFVDGSEILVVSPNYSAKSLNSKYFDLGFELRHDMVAVTPDGKTIAAIIPTYISTEELVGELWTVDVASGIRSKIMSVRLQTQGKVTWSHDSKSVFLY